VAAASFAPANLTFPNTSASPSATSAPVTVTFSNGGGSPMTLTNIYFAGLNPGDFIRPAGVAGGTCPTVPAPLANGASCTVSVQFKPMAIGFRQANLSFSDNATNTTDQTIPLTGTGTDTNAPVFTVSPSTVNFGSVNTGTPSAAQTVTVTKTGGGPLNIATVTVAGANAADFTMTQNCTGSPVLANCAISVVFQPAAVGARSATLTLAHNTIPSGATSTDIALSGTGTSAAPTPTTTLAFGSNPVQFGTFDLRRLQTKDQTVSLRNSGQNATAGLGNITVTGSGYKLQSHNCPATLAKGASCSIVVRFTPPNVAGVSNGSLSATAGNAVPTTVTTSLAATTR
jgi:trimeric autotransporter adhesin